MALFLYFFPSHSESGMAILFLHFWTIWKPAGSFSHPLARNQRRICPCSDWISYRQIILIIAWKPLISTGKCIPRFAHYPFIEGLIKDCCCQLQTSSFPCIALRWSSGPVQRHKNGVCVLRRRSWADRGTPWFPFSRISISDRIVVKRGKQLNLFLNSWWCFWGPAWRIRKKICSSNSWISSSFSSYTFIVQQTCPFILIPLVGDQIVILTVSSLQVHLRVIHGISFECFSYSIIIIAHKRIWVGKAMRRYH